MSRLIYDCEIWKCIPSKAGTFSDYIYCSGWTDFQNMGISCIGYHYEGAAKVFRWQDSDDLKIFLEAIASADAIIGFNSWAFDDLLLRANGVEIETTYDLLAEVRLTAFGSSNWEDTPEGYSYSLDVIARANGMAKTGSGSLAPQLWQQGREQEVLDYCLNDVLVTERLLGLGLSGELIDPNTGELLQLKTFSC